MNSQKRVIVFDLDGVILDSISLLSEFTQNSYINFNHQEVKELFKGNIFDSIQKIQERKIKETEEERKNRVAIYTEKKSKVGLCLGIKELLEILSKENILVINTSALLQNCLPVLQKNKIEEYFDFIVTKETHSSKIEKFSIIAKKYNVKNSELIFITDTVGDVKEAYEAGVPTVVVTWGLHTKEDFGDVSKNVLSFINTPQELLHFLTIRK